MKQFHKIIAADEVLFREGEIGQCAYLIDRGRIAIVLEQNGESQTLSELGPGECVGEMALISNQPRMASAIAKEITTLTVITREHLHERLQQSDPFVRHLLQLTLQRYRQAMGQEHVPVLSEFAGTMENDDESLALSRMRTEQALVEALHNRELVLFFQPIVRLRDRVTTGFEALLRWQHPGEGLIAPDAFIPVAEDSHIIKEIGRWTITDACRCRKHLASQWEGRLDPDFTVSVNIAARQFSDRQLLPCIRQALLRHELPAEHLRLEITESQVLNNWDQALNVLLQARALGCRIAVDDFGTGHSSLAYLNRLPVDTLKIDKVFLQDFLTDDASRKIIAGIAALAQCLGMSFIAEGGETEEQIELLESLGVEQVQGYYFGRPFALD